MPLDMSPLDAILNDVRNALAAKLYYLALATTMSLPDICVSLACEPAAIWTNQTKYEPWCERWLVPKYKHLSARDCYRVRCGVAHNGNFGRADKRFDRVMFSLPGNAQIKELVMTGNVMNGVALRNLLVLNVAIFCSEMDAAVKEWLTRTKAIPTSRRTCRT